MTDTEHHTKIAQENFKGALEELKNGRFSNVGLLSLRALEQAVEACAAKEGLHFHEHPRTAHRNRRSWLKTHHPDLVEIWDKLWGVYGALGYAGVNGERARKAVVSLKECLKELFRREKIAFSGL